ncbi:CsxC family protein [Thermotalea metallivorans]|uniref:SipL SPOCS domain-containing protein n=1 Tax=Thermotalea metallivorans TaxID=520762 RepID=A0A140L6E4_9FIRM|nr:hypothetical protein [Thermotalea metallivorans]KXG76119.1 hypothetical protein AN619_10760 [Thermotalea metallivorans]
MSWKKYNDAQNLQMSPLAAHKASATCVKVTGGTTSDCVNQPVPITSLRSGAIVKIPVVLAELTVQINVDSIIDLPEPAWEIKNIKKHVKITQCLLLQDTNMLFIKGFVRKNIDYTTRECSNSQGFCGDIKHCTVDVPFSCTTPVNFNGIAPIPPVPRTKTEFEYFKRQDLSGPGFAEKDELLSGDLSEFNQISTEYFNELPFCELISSRIVEFDEFLNPIHPKFIKAPFEEKFFRSIEEKMVIFLTLKILQNRQVAIPPVAIAPIDHDC